MPSIARGKGAGELKVGIAVAIVLALAVVLLAFVLRDRPPAEAVILERLPESKGASEDPRQALFEQGLFETVELLDPFELKEGVAGGMPGEEAGIHYRVVQVIDDSSALIETLRNDGGGETPGPVFWLKGMGFEGIVDEQRVTFPFGDYRVSGSGLFNSKAGPRTLSIVEPIETLPYR
jgi:hypothetical protein